MTSERWGLWDLVHRRIKFSAFDELNDPFELLSAYLGEQDARRFYRELHSAVCKRFVLICLSESWKSPVMWAHYAEKHTGLCLGFDVKRAVQVQYEPERLKHKIDNSSSKVTITSGLIKAAMLTKFSEWNYEKEWRFFGDLNDLQPNAKGLYFLPFGEGFALREVIIGARCKLSPKQVAASVRDIQSDVTIKKARAAFQKFEIVEQKRIKPLVVMPRTR